MKTIEEINQHNVKQILTDKKIPEFFPGDVVKVGVRITEGKKERIQYFEGVCIAKKNRDLNSSFTVRKISFGEGVERTFALFSPIVDSIKVIRSGKVRRAKLYYLRDRTGKSARIADRDRGDEADQYSLQENISQTNNKDQEKVPQNNENESDEKNIEENISSSEISNDKNEKIAAEEKKSAEEKSESTAKEAEKTEDESK